MATSPTGAPAPPARVLIGLPFLSAGAGLVLYLLAGFSLPLAIMTVLVLAGAVALVVMRRLPRVQRGRVAARAVRGAIAGLAATAAYDVSRLAVVSAFGLGLRPFDTIVRFGHLLAGDAASSVLTVLAGITYHYANGIGFAIAYVFLVRRPGVVSGVLWAAVLEAIMVSLYPGWLGLRALDEFLGVSAVGHLAYGVVLGSAAAALLRMGPARGSDDLGESEGLA